MKNVIFTLVFLFMSYLSYAITYDITLKVDVSHFNSEVSMVKVNGGFSGWSAYELVNTTGGIWEVTVPMDSGAVTDYRYEIIDISDGWHPEWPENNATDACFVNGNMRGITVVKDSILNVVCWESCNSCVSTYEEAISFNVINLFVNNSNNIVIDGFAEGNSKTSLYNMQGKLLFVETFNSVEGERHVLQTGHLSQGLYVVEIINGSDAYTEKIMIE